jgi:hypothetical protein
LFNINPLVGGGDKASLVSGGGEVDAMTESIFKELVEILSLTGGGIF